MNRRPSRFCARAGLGVMACWAGVTQAATFATDAAADTAAEPASVTPIGTSPAGVLEVFASLLLVLALIFALAWLARSLQTARLGAGALIRIQAGAQVGPKERVVLLQVGEQQLLVGVTAASVTLLHRFDAPLTVADAEAVPASGTFAQRLRQALGKEPT